MTAASFQTRLNSLQADLRAALLAGGSTAPIRVQIVALEAEARAAAELAARTVAETEAEERDRLRTSAEAIAGEVAARLSARMDSLRPPEQPILPDQLNLTLPCMRSVR